MRQRALMVFVLVLWGCGDSNSGTSNNTPSDEGDADVAEMDVEVEDTPEALPEDAQPDAEPEEDAVEPEDTLEDAQPDALVEDAQPDADAESPPDVDEPDLVEMDADEPDVPQEPEHPVVEVVEAEPRARFVPRDFENPLDFSARDLVPGEGVAWAVDSSSMIAVDVSRPERPEIAHTTPLAATRKIRRSGDRLAVVDRDSDAGTFIHLFDIDNPLQPTLAGNHRVSDTTEFHFDVSDTHAYVADGQTLHVVDITDPQAIDVVGSVDLSVPRGNPGRITGVAVDGDKLVTILGGGAISFRIYDLSDPAAPDLDFRDEIRAFAAGYSNLSAHNGLAMREEAARTEIIDLATRDTVGRLGATNTDPWMDDQGLIHTNTEMIFEAERLRALRSYQVEGEDAFQLWRGGGVLYIRGRAGLHTLSEATRDAQIRGALTFEPPLFFAHTIMEGDRAWGIFGERAFVMDIADPQAPTFTETVVDVDNPQDLIKAGERIFVATSEGLKCLDLEGGQVACDFDGPQRLQHLDRASGRVMAGGGGGAAIWTDEGTLLWSDEVVTVAVALSDTRGYVVTREEILVLDLDADPVAVVGGVRLNDDLDVVLELEARGELLYVGDRERLLTVDLSDLAQPRVVSAQALGDDPVKMWQEGDLLGVCTDKTLFLYDLTRPEAPVLDTAYQALDSVGSCAASGGLALMYPRDHLEVIDLRSEADLSGPRDSEVEGGDTLQYTLSGIPETSVVRCSVTGGTCQITERDDPRRAEVQWTLPGGPGDHEIAVGHGGVVYFEVSGRRSVSVR